MSVSKSRNPSRKSEAAIRPNSMSRSTTRSRRAHPDPRGLDVFEAGLSHTFTDRGLLLEALTHASAETNAARRRHAIRVNERLEFLGDRVLGLLAAQALHAAFPDAPEGELAPRLNALVRKETFATSGSRIAVRLFGGWGYDEHLLEAPDAVAAADASGVPMGGTLPAAPPGASRRWRPRWCGPWR